MNSPKVIQINSNRFPMQGKLSVDKDNREPGIINTPLNVKSNPDDSDWNDFSKYGDPSHVVPGMENPNKPSTSNTQYGQMLPQENRPLNQGFRFPNAKLNLILIDSHITIKLLTVMDERCLHVVMVG